LRIRAVQQEQCRYVGDCLLAQHVNMRLPCSDEIAGGFERQNQRTEVSIGEQSNYRAVASIQESRRKVVDRKHQS
jgi:hypothetical protein